MRYELLLVAAGYLAFLVGVALFEWVRNRGKADALSTFVVVALLQCAVPGVIMYSLLPFTNELSPTSNPVLDRILQSVDLTSASAVLLLTIWFIIFFYIGAALGRLVLPRLTEAERDRYTVLVRTPAVLLVLVFGFALTVYSFMLLGDSLLARYTNLILFRAGFEGIERNALNANAFALTQAWSWLSIVAIFAIREQRGRKLLWVFCLIIVILLALLGVSRRALFLPVLLAYLTIVLYHRQWYWRWLAAAALPILLIIAFGKETLASLAWSGNLRLVTTMYESVVSAMLRAVSEVGLTILESVGTLLFLDLPPRLGVDHVLSIARRFPEGMLGFSFEFPERIVRLSTEAFAGASEQDIPPGLAGQMWLDFRMLGPVIWGILFGLQVSLVQYFFERTRRTRQSAVIYIIIIFVIALPVTTGSFDFTLSVDIFALVATVAFCVRLHRNATPAAPDRVLGARAPTPFTP